MADEAFSLVLVLGKMADFFVSFRFFSFSFSFLDNTNSLVFHISAC